MAGNHTLNTGQDALSGAKRDRSQYPPHTRLRTDGFG